MQITNEMIKTLREKTGAGMMDCKRALEAVAGDMNLAIEFLRKKGAAVGAKRADRAAKEGMIVTRVAPDGKSGVIVEVNCETDFVGRSEDFTGFANKVATVVEQKRPSSVEELMKQNADGKTVSELYNDLLAKVGEKIDVRRFAIVETKEGAISAYTHLGNKIGVLVELQGSDAASSQGRDVAMQVAAMNPLVVSREEVDKGLIERELDIYRTQAKNEGKPDQIVDKIAVGRLEKYYQEVVLMEQTFIKDSGKTIKDYLATAGQPVTVKRFLRFHLGEEIK
ncbi:MAG: translation elongation factor Ts [bacterium]